MHSCTCVWPGPRPSLCCDKLTGLTTTLSLVSAAVMYIPAVIVLSDIWKIVHKNCTALICASLLCSPTNNIQFFTYYSSALNPCEIVVSDIHPTLRPHTSGIFPCRYIFPVDICTAQSHFKHHFAPVASSKRGTKTQTCARFRLNTATPGLSTIPQSSVQRRGPQSFLRDE